MTPTPMRQSTLILLVGLAIFGALVFPNIVSALTQPNFFEEEFTTETGETYECIIYSDYQAGGIDCAIENATPSTAPTDK